MFVNSWDSFGEYCGMNNSALKILSLPKNLTLHDYSEYKYAFFSASDVSNMICVKECPKNGTLGAALANGTASIVSRQLHCQSDVICPPYITDEEKSNLTYLFEHCSCSYKTSVLLNRCIPEIDGNFIQDSKEFINKVFSKLSSNSGFSQAMMAMFKLWKPLLFCSVISILISYIWIYFLRCVTGCLVYFVVIFIPIALIFLGVWLFLFGANFAGINDNKRNKIIAYVCWGVAVLLIVLLIFLWKRLRQAITTLKIASKATTRNFGSFFSPFISLLWVIAFWVVVIVSCVMNYSVGGLMYDPDEQKIKNYFDKNCQYLCIFNFIFLIFISAHCYFTNYYAVSGTVVKWYFEGQKGTCCGCWCIISYLKAWTKALGTIAMTTFIMTPIYVFIILLKWAEKKAKDQNASKIVKGIIKCLQCCCCCLEKILKFLNKNILTVHQIYNLNWGAAAKITIKILMGDIVLTALVNGITAFVMILSKILVSAICTIIFVVYVRYVNPDQTGYMLPAALVFVLGFVLSSFILNLYDDMVDIVFICFLADKDLTQEGSVRPMYAESDVTQLIDNMKKNNAVDTKVEAAESGQPE